MKQNTPSFLLLMIVALLTMNSAYAQLLATHPLEVSKGPLSFTPSVVKANKIKSIILVMVDKPDGQVIVDKGATQGYVFDTIGRVTRYYYTILNSIEREEVDVPAIKRKGHIIRPATTKTVLNYKNDTIFTDLYYDAQGRVISKRIRTGDYYDAWYYEYNEQGRIGKEMHCKETNVAENRNEFKLGVQTILSSETFTYEMLTPTQYRKICYNDEGREYKKSILNFDAEGNKLSERFDFIVSWMHSETNYTYNSNGWLLSKELRNNESGEMSTRSEFEYGTKGEVLVERKFKNNELQMEMNYLYDASHTLIRSEADRDHKNSSIIIVKYGYEFY